MLRLPLAFSLLFGSFLGASTCVAQAPVEVMIVGTMHMSNPGRDIHNVQIDDVLLPKSQAQIKAAIDGIAAFRPTKVMAEWPQTLATERYAQYQAGTLKPSHNEVVQLGFRLAKQAGLPTVYGIDVDGEFPYDAVQNFTKAHGQQPLLQRLNDEVEATVKATTEMLQTGGVTATLRYLNDPQRLRNDNAFYRQMLFIGSGAEQPGAELLTAWYRRNFLICANLLQASKPGDRIVVFYGSGHAFLLRQCIAETPGFRLIEANTFLPKGEQAPQPHP